MTPRAKTMRVVARHSTVDAACRATVYRVWLDRRPCQHPSATIISITLTGQPLLKLCTCCLCKHQWKQAMAGWLHISLIRTGA